MLEICLKQLSRYSAWRILIPVLLLACAGNFGFAQANPGAREDEEIARQKILRAADQIEVINDQHNKVVEELEKLRAQIKTVSDANDALSGQIAEIKAQAAKEREALLDQISKLMADQEKRLSEKIQASAKASAEAKPKPVAPPKETSVPVKEDGYEYVVKPGETLWAIAKAFQDQGVKVTVEEIRKANSLKEGQSLKAGQKLFIPGK